MTKETYKIAETLRKDIQHLEVKQTQIKLMKDREVDHEFTTLKQLAFDGCDYAIKNLEDKFNAL